MEKINEAIENLEQVVETKDPIETVGTMDHVMADAYIQSEKVDKHIQEVTDELNVRAEAIILDPPADNAEKMPKSIYTENKLKLEEDFNDFEIQEEPKKDGRSHRQAARDENDGNKFLDYDMFTFIHELFAGQNCNTNPAPMTPVIYGKIVNRKTKEVTYGMRPMRKFMDSGVENRKVAPDERNFGVPQVSTDGDKIIISAAQKDDLDDVIEACKIFSFTHSDPEPALSRYTHWPWRITVNVPVTRPGHPMKLEEYLTSIDKTIEDVMFPDFAKSYRREVAKIEANRTKDIEGSSAASAKIQSYGKSKEAQVDALLDDPKFNEIFNNAVTVAANDDSPLKDHAKQFVADLQAAGITFNRQIAIDLFMAEFDDELSEEE